MDLKKYYKYMFLSGAIWNMAVGLSTILIGLIAYDFGANLFGLTPPPSNVFLYGFLTFVVVLGIGLFVLSYKQQEYYWIVVMYAIEKFAISIVILVHYFMGDFNFFMVGIVLVDIVYGILFTEFLIRFWKEK